MSNKINNLYKFDKYVLNAKEKNLWRENELINLPPRAFDTLQMLVERSGEILSKEEMMETIWEDTFVEENNLSQKISILRKTFGKENNFIETVPRKGFRFVEHVEAFSDTEFAKVKTNGNKTSEPAEDNQPPKNSSLENESVKETYFFQRRPILLTLGIIVFVSLSFVGYTYFGGQNADSNSPKLELQALTDTGNTRFPTISPDGNSLAFVKSDNPNLFVKDLDTGVDVEVKIDNGLAAGFSKFSPDGTHIFFLTRKRQTELADIYKIPNFGGTAELIVKGVYGQFDISPDGNQIVYINRNDEKKRFELIARDIFSKEEKILSSKEFPKGFHWLSPPSWSLDGTKIAVVQKDTPGDLGKLLVVDVDSKSEQVIKAIGIKTIIQALWMPSNKELLLLAAKNKGNHQIFRVTYPDGEITAFSNDLREYRNLSISKDGKRITTRTHGISSNIWLLPEGDKNRKKQVTEGDFGIHGLFGISWTPNNKIVHYQRGKGESQIQIVDPTDKSKRILASNTAGMSQYPYVSPDGKKVFFQSTEKGIVKVKSVEIENEKTKILNPSGEHAEQYPVVSPDNKWVYFIQRNKKETAICRQSLTGDKKETIINTEEFSSNSFLSISPDGKHLAFNYPKKENETTTKLGFIDLTDNFRLKTLDVPLSRPYIQWTNGGKTFDYSKNTKTGSQLWRQAFVGDSAPKLITEFENESIYYFSWSKDEKNLALAIGNNKRDAILFELK